MIPNTSGAGVTEIVRSLFCVGVAIVTIALCAFAVRAASNAISSWFVKSAQEKSVAASDVTTIEACADFVLRASALAFCTFFFIDGSGFFENLDAILYLPWGLGFADVPSGLSTTRRSQVLFLGEVIYAVKVVISCCTKQTRHQKGNEFSICCPE